MKKKNNIESFIDLLSDSMAFFDTLDSNNIKITKLPDEIKWDNDLVNYKEKKDVI
jgi:hypothetical protein